MKSYGDSIKSKYFPSASKKKQAELKHIRQSLEMPAREKYGHKALLSDQDERKRIYTERMKHYKSMPRKTLNHTPQAPRAGQNIDYLKEFRSSKKSSDKFSTIPKNLIDWKSDINQHSLDSHSKEQRIRRKANILKNEALYKEKMMGNKKKDQPVQDLDDINELLF
eukprot:CAMPEP_0205812256 /NCGR_PEP_ID=MMETSP0205-20121125/16666_1 /ASSEMBLY_ACC=CAM_ASM_000278 /TAXON_ID=36767 /ORGANISM="Euplotes focardii, Strain TN1" /LENGTH=165 /DNA_ID=CAMNT_0053092665 /DNA_START=458 /DNA_END=952 /DNA_ORIENTATION=-